MKWKRKDKTCQEVLVDNVGTRIGQKRSGVINEEIGLVKKGRLTDACSINN
jgi:hypothetical protein